MGTHCDSHSFETVDGSIPVRACNLDPGSLRTTSVESPSSASTMRGAAIAARKNRLFITETRRWLMSFRCRGSSF